MFQTMRGMSDIQLHTATVKGEREIGCKRFFTALYSLNSQKQVFVYTSHSLLHHQVLAMYILISAHLQSIILISAYSESNTPIIAQLQDKRGDTQSGRGSKQSVVEYLSNPDTRAQPLLRSIYTAFHKLPRSCDHQPFPHYSITQQTYKGAVNGTLIHNHIGQSSVHRLLNFHMQPHSFLNTEVQIQVMYVYMQVDMCVGRHVDAACRNSCVMNPLTTIRPTHPLCIPFSTQGANMLYTHTHMV